MARPAAFAVEAGQALRLRLRGTDRLLEAEVMEHGNGRTRLRLLNLPEGLRRADFDRGVVLEMVHESDRYAVEDVRVDAVDLTEGSLTIEGVEALERSVRRANFREPVRRPIAVTTKAAQAVGETTEMGGGGLRFWSKTPIAIDERDQVRFVVELEDGPLEGTGRLSWKAPSVRGHAAGLVFETLDGRGHDRLYGLLYRQQARRRRSGP